MGSLQPADVTRVRASSDMRRHFRTALDFSRMSWVLKKLQVKYTYSSVIPVVIII